MECKRIDAATELVRELAKVKEPTRAESEKEKIRVVMKWSVARPWKGCRCGCNAYPWGRAKPRS